MTEQTTRKRAYAPRKRSDAQIPPGTAIDRIKRCLDDESRQLAVYTAQLERRLASAPERAREETHRRAGEILLRVAEIDRPFVARALGLDAETIESMIACASAPPAAPPAGPSTLVDAADGDCPAATFAEPEPEPEPVKPAKPKRAPRGTLERRLDDALNASDRKRVAKPKGKGK